MLRTILAVLLAMPAMACSSSAAPAALPSSSPEPQGPKPAPAAAGSRSSQLSAEPVAAAITEYVEAANVAMRTGDTARFRQVVTADCTCLAFAETIETYAAESTRAVGARWELGEVRIAEKTPRDARAIVSVRSSGYEIRSPLDVEEVPARTASQFVRLAKEDAWRVADVDEL